MSLLDCLEQEQKHVASGPESGEQAVGKVTRQRQLTDFHGMCELAIRCKVNLSKLAFNCFIFYSSLTKMLLLPFKGTILG